MISNIRSQKKLLFDIFGFFIDLTVEEEQLTEVALLCLNSPAIFDSVLLMCLQQYFVWNLFLILAGTLFTLALKYQKNAI